MSRLLRIACITVVILLMGLDPYTYGRIGGDIVAVLYPWQRWVAAIQVGLLIIGAISSAIGIRELRVLGVELSIFLVFNAFLVSRDGITRFVTGYESAVTTGLIVLAGLLVRILVLRSTFIPSELSGIKENRTF